MLSKVNLIFLKAKEIRVNSKLNDFIINNEIRFLFAKKSYLQAFFDFAGYEKRLTNNYRSDFPFGFGIGIAFDTKAGIFSLNYALGKQLGNPIKFASGKINFGYTAVF